MIDGTTLEEIKMQTKRDCGDNCCGKCKYFKKYAMPRCRLFGGYPDFWFPPWFQI